MIHNIAMAHESALELLAKASPQAIRPKRAVQPFPLGDRVAIVELVGLIDGDNSARTENLIRAAAHDQSIREIILRIDSPGGFASAAFPLAEGVKEAAAVKPVHAFIAGMAASAAYMSASQCSTITGSGWCSAGSIGTYTVLVDSSETLRRIGLKVIVVKAGEMKATGVPGVVVSPEQVADVQRTTNDINGLFLANVARGRKLGMREVLELADGRLWIGRQAIERKLIDRIQPESEFMRNVLNRNPREEFLDLYGCAAAAKFASLCGVKNIGEVSRADAALVEKMALTHPTLAERALAHKPPARAYSTGSGTWFR